MLFDNIELLEVAYISKPTGLKGLLSLRTLDNFSDSIFKENIPVFLNIEGIPVPFFTESVKNSGNSLTIKLKHIDTEEEASKYKSCPILVFASSVIEEEEDYDMDFELYNYDVYDKNSGYIGKIVDVNMIPGNPVFETEFQGKTIILPYSEEFIENINHEIKRVDINAPAGLIDIYL